MAETLLRRRPGLWRRDPIPPLRAHPVVARALPRHRDRLQPRAPAAGGATARRRDHFRPFKTAPRFRRLLPIVRAAASRGHELGNPAEIPYLNAGEAKFAVWAERLWALLPRGYRRIGIAWAGRPTHRNDLRRSTRLAAFAPLATIPQVALVSLQKGPAQAEIGNYWGHAPLLNLGPEIGDFADTAAIIECLELVIAVDTAVAHLAGAMGKPVWVMLPYAARLALAARPRRQPVVPDGAPLPARPAPGQWDPVVAEIARRRWSANEEEVRTQSAPGLRSGWRRDARRRRYPSLE